MNIPYWDPLGGRLRKKVMQLNNKKTSRDQIEKLHSLGPSGKDSSIGAGLFIYQRNAHPPDKIKGDSRDPQ